MQRKGSFDKVIILALICLIVISSVSLDTVFSYFSDKTGTEGNTTMGYIELVSLTNLDGSEIGDAENLDSDQTFTGEYKLITNTNINYYVYIFLKGTITPDGDKTHDTSCTDYYADDTDCLDITVNGYSKLDTKADGYTIYYKLCTIQTAGQNTQTFSISASIKTDLVENGCDYYDNATILFDMKVKTKQADYLQANEYTLGFSSPLVNKALCSIGFIVPVQDVSKYPNLTFTVTDSNTKTMSIAPADTNITEINIPHQVEMNGEIYTITSIPNSAFIDCGNLTTVTISEGVTSLDSASFRGCTNLTSVTLPSSLTSIANMSFSGCTSLTSIDIPDSVTYIGTMSFNGCSSLISVHIPAGVTSITGSTFRSCTSLESINIPEGVTAIYDSAFKGCTSLTSITIPSSLTFIDSEVFYNCTSLTSITIPSSVTYIGSAFGGCTSLTAINVDSGNTAYSSIDGTLFDKDATQLIACPAGKTGGYTIPNGVTSIGEYAFYHCTNLTSITIPNSVTSIGTRAFYNCTNLTSVTFENTEDWHLSSTTGDEIDVTNASTNATNLKSSSGAWYNKSLYRV